MQTRRSLISGGIAVAMATRLGSQPAAAVHNWDQTILDAHVDDLIQLATGHRSMAAWFNAARSLELLAAHCESTNMARAMEASIKSNPAVFDSLAIDYAGIAKLAAWRPIWSFDLVKLESQFERIPVATRRQLQAFLSNRGSFKVMADSVAEGFRAQAKFAAVAGSIYRTVQCTTDQTGTTSCAMLYPFANSSSCAQWTYLGFATAVLGTLWGAAPALIPESFVCPLCAIASAGFGLIAAGMGMLAYGFC